MVISMSVFSYVCNDVCKGYIYTLSGMYVSLYVLYCIKLCMYLYSYDVNTNTRFTNIIYHQYPYTTYCIY